jgi:hypothetical protein
MNGPIWKENRDGLEEVESQNRRHGQDRNGSGKWHH